MFGSNYAWILFGELEIDKVITNDTSLIKDLNCTRDQLAKALERAILTSKLYLRQDNQTTLSGLVSTMEEFMKRWSFSRSFNET